MTSGTWNLLAIGILARYRGRGIGGAMMRYLEDRLRTAGERVLLVETMGTPAFERTRAFYRANGYAEEARIREFYEPGRRQGRLLEAPLKDGEGRRPARRSPPGRPSARSPNIFRQAGWDWGNR